MSFIQWKYVLVDAATLALWLKSSAWGTAFILPFPFLITSLGLGIAMGGVASTVPQPFSSNGTSGDMTGSEFLSKLDWPNRFGGV